MGTESPEFEQLKTIADQIDALNRRLEAENAKLRTAIVLLTDAVDALLSSVAMNETAIERVRAANEAARQLATVS